ncbi:neural/ectodermal development factor IMP-L2 [Copidosoma floridanum]|uniref:neural/ectodermal development factor IMP-L2 n=1 Tax=Copidosoma floridanum TaxID=29053 RepID=UPI0006C9C5C1|nr:neural/ectodermal development factor IMP-L2 [Copidosoma floridanum]
MQRPGNCSYLSVVGMIWLVVLVTEIGSSNALSFKQVLHDVDQEISAKDEGNYPDDPPEFDLQPPDFHAQSSQQKILEKYVKLTSSPKGGVLTLVRGDRLELTCEVDGSPAPLVYWVRGEDPDFKVSYSKYERFYDDQYHSVAREVSKLVIDAVTSRDEGEIYCVGFAGGLKVESNHTTLVVVEGEEANRGFKYTEPLITRHRPLYFSEKGSTVVLPCEATGNPRPHVTWYNGTQKLKSGSRLAVDPYGSLVIKDLRWHDMGGYKCVASSRMMGTAEAETFLYPAARSKSA